ncbi:MAG: alginate lyase family protein [Acidobacteriaceae bacterium]|nr:alginate lyase family protein [Acidobacteriaceae bacterium]
MRIIRCLCVAFLLLRVVGRAHGQSPSLFLSEEDFKARQQLAQHETWAHDSLRALIQEADDFPHAYKTRFGVADAAPPPEGGQWLHWYACPETGTPLQFHPPDQNICPETGKNFTGYPYDHVVYQLRNDALAEAAVALGLAFRFTHKEEYAQKAAGILKDYARVYPTYALHDNYGKAGPNGAKAYSQTLDESIWLIKIAWTYDLIRGTNALSTAEKQEIEDKVLRASAAMVSKAHKEPTYNIQSWINGALAAVGFTLNDKALIREAIDGPIGFRYQMHHFVTEGFWAEGAWGYQFYAMRPLTMTAQMAARKGIDLWKQEPNLSALFHSPLGVLLPDGRLPAFNDSGSVDLYEQAYLYEVAYAATSDPALLPVLEHRARSNREAFLFGAEHLPHTVEPKLTSTVFPEAGYATLRSPSNDLTVVMKFGPHGGAHGHFDKLNFVLFANGQTLAVDPGTYPYGLPIHREWDSMTVAHNTISVDQQRQDAATGKLLNWRAGDGWTAVSADAGPVYTMAHLRRTMLLTPNYVLILDECESVDGQAHTFDWAYHNAGMESLVSSLQMKPSTLSTANGYQHLGNSNEGITSKAIAVRFISQTADVHEPVSNSTPATYRSNDALQPRSKVQSSNIELNLQMLSAPATEVIIGDAPARGSKNPAPFVLVRRSGTSATFATLLTAADEQTSGTTRKITFKQTARGKYQVEGPGFSDIFSAGESFNLQHRVE